ncbi:MAG: NAD(P)/FAD-dependent oxidoreductase [Candidatus Kapaibacterium sp.]|nr:MAG: NAD(P)/FAD-dependent oxidoreductase [Candidatus Kapabacteria bacterium]
MNIPSSTKPRVVIVGGGFGGIELARALNGEAVQVVLFDRNNFHTFQPLLYQVSTAGLEPDSIAFPLRKVFKRSKNVFFRWGEVLRVVPEKNMLETSIGELSYDYLVLATGSTTNFFGMKSVAENAMPMKTVAEALNLRSTILQAFEAATLTAEQKQRQELMTFVVVGGGPTGVETAGALAELKKHVLPHDFPELDLRLMRVFLLEATPRLLNGMSDGSGASAVEALQRMGVNVLLGAAVKDYDGATIHLQDGSAIAARTLIWAAGVVGQGVEGVAKESIVRGNRMKVDEYNRVEGYGNIYAIGDVAAMPGTDERYPNGHPMVAPVAMQQGQLLAANILRMTKHQAPEAFRYFDKGSMATIGRNRAVVDVAALRFTGWIAWVMWLGLHLLMLVGFRNKLVVMINWIWNYLSYDRGTRLIVRPFRRDEKQT